MAGCRASPCRAKGTPHAPPSHTMSLCIFKLPAELPSACTKGMTHPQEVFRHTPDPVSPPSSHSCHPFASRPQADWRDAQHWLDCTLEEIHSGCTKSLAGLARVPDRLLDPDADQACPSPATFGDLSVCVAPGAAEGTRYIFTGQVCRWPGLLDNPTHSLPSQLQRAQHMHGFRPGSRVGRITTLTCPILP